VATTLLKGEKNKLTPSLTLLLRTLKKTTRIKAKKRSKSNFQIRNKTKLYDLKTKT
jgi:hypothetical protein